MFLNKALYSLRTLVSSFRTNLLINLTALTTITLTFVIFTFFILLLLNLSVFEKGWVERVHVMVYLNDGMNPESVQTLSGYIEEQPEVASVRFVSKKEAMASLKTSLEGQDGILEGLSYNPLPDSLEIIMKQQFLKIDSIEGFIKKLDKKDGITDIEYGQKWLERFNRFIHILRTAGLGIGVFLFISSLFIISNTIKLMVYSRREEIEIMKLVGASRLFIKIPFFLEGIMQGLLGSVFAIMIVYILTLLISKNIVSGFHFYFGTHALLFLAPFQLFFVVFIGFLLGLTGAFISLNGLKEFKI